MVEAISIDPKTVILKSDDEADMSKIINLVVQQGKSEAVSAFLKFAAQNRVIDKDFKFNREECYDR